MTTQPTPHIGTTLAQRAILRYRLEQRELAAIEAEARGAEEEMDNIIDTARIEPRQYVAGPAANDPSYLTRDAQRAFA